MILELIKAAALLLALSLLYGFIARIWKNNKPLEQIFCGVLFGGICVIGMMMPIEFAPGVIFDPRSVVLASAGLFGGPVVAGISAAIAGAYRIWLGGSGVYVGVSVVIVSCALGLAYRYGKDRGWLKINFPGLLIFGFIVHVTVVLLFTQLPLAIVEQVMKTIAVPFILIFTPATVFLGLLLKDTENRIKTESALVESESKLAMHLQNTSLAAISWDTDFCCTQWNKAAENIFKYTAEEVLGRHAADFLIPEGIKEEVDRVFKTLLAQQGGTRNTNENLTGDGRKIFCEWHNTPIVNALGQVIGISSLAEDITLQMQTEAEMKLQNTLLLTQQEASMDGIFALDTKSNLISMNQRFIDLWRIPSAIAQSNSYPQILDTILERLVNPAQFMSVMRHFEGHNEDSSADEIMLKDKRTFERYSAPMISKERHYYGRVWRFRDITARKRSEELIWNQANFDPLTGLPNRQMLYNRLQQEMKKADRSGTSIALLYLDLDQFKEVNDSLGHDAGDNLLKQAAQRLNTYIREADTLARLGGDEFTIIISGLKKSTRVDRVANDILKEMAVPFQLEHEKPYISTSIGITLYPEDASTVDEMLKNADQAMYAAKNRGRNCFQYFTSSMQEAAFSRMTMIKDLRAALPGNQFQLYYQPIVDLASGQIYKGEALLRWLHPTQGLVSPDQFIPLAEETRIIIEIGDWVFMEAARQSARWRQSFCADFQVSINTSPIQYQNDDFNINHWLKHLDKLGVSGQAIAIEITEGLLMETISRISAKLLMFRDAGIQVSLDDFGTGYSSLSYLRKFDIDYLKIDRSFVQNLRTESDDLSLCEAIIVMAHKLGLKVVAEGIETVEQSTLLHKAGCDYGQGYFFSRPVSADEFEKLLVANTNTEDT